MSILGRLPLAASSTLNRLELGTPESASSDRYKRIAADSKALDRLLVDLFLESYRKPPRKIWLDRCQPWRAKRRLVDPSSREAALLTRRAHSARGEAK